MPLAPPPSAMAAPLLKDLFDAARMAQIARALAEVAPGVDSAAFQALCLEGLAPLSLMQRLHRVADALHQVLPSDFARALPLLLALAPRLPHAFATMAVGEYVARHGGAHFEASMQALQQLTRLGSCEFAVRAFLQREPARTLAQMHQWAGDSDAHVRRLASEGCRPRLPWASRLAVLDAAPPPAAAILEQLRADSSLYVRKSVANHLNDLSKLQPDWVLERLAQWPRELPETAWICRHALRSLIKQGEPRALALVGASEGAQALVQGLGVHPQQVQLGQEISLSFDLVSTASTAQRLVVDYRIHYVRASGALSAKVFKLKTLDLPAGAHCQLQRRQTLRNFSTRTHYPGLHKVDVLVNGQCLSQTMFMLHT